MGASDVFYFVQMVSNHAKHPSGSIFTLFHQFIKENVFKNGQVKFQVFQKFYLVHLENYDETAERHRQWSPTPTIVPTAK